MGIWGKTKIDCHTSGTVKGAPQGVKRAHLQPCIYTEFEPNEEIMYMYIPLKL